MHIRVISHSHVIYMVRPFPNGSTEFKSSATYVKHTSYTGAWSTYSRNSCRTCLRLCFKVDTTAVNYGKKQWFSVLSTVFEHDRNVSSTHTNFRARDAVK